MRKLISAMTLAVGVVMSAGVSANVEKGFGVEQKAEFAVAKDCDSKKSISQSSSSDTKSSFKDLIHLASINCGIAPIPPIGCRVGACVCDQYGRNCRYTFICN